jgi:hypothetical protein
MPDHLEVAGHIVEHLGHIFTEPTHSGTAGPAKAGFIAIGMMNELFARQVVRQWPALRLHPVWAALRGAGQLGRGLAFRLVRFQLFKLQFKLLDCQVETFRRAPELHAPQPCELHLQLLDLQPAQLNCRHRRREFGLTGQRECSQRVGIGREIGSRK